MNIASRYQCLRVLILTVLVAVLVFGNFGIREINAHATPECDTVTEVNGVYEGSGQCVVRNLKNHGALEFTPRFGEIDRIKYFSGCENNVFYQVDIEIKEDKSFEEKEIGPLVGSTIRTSTSNVSDKIFPVLEEYLFKTDSSCKAIGFTKVVRNPSYENFKSCVVDFKKIR